MSKKRDGARLLSLSLTFDQAMALADQNLQAGRLAEAEALCRDILRAQPNSAPALHLLGIIRHHAGRLLEAIDLVRRAVRADGSVALYHCNLGEMYRLAGQRDAALAAGRRALAIDPDFPAALNNVGIVHYERDEFDEAAAYYRRAITLAPTYAEAHSNLGNALRAEKNYEEALVAYRQALVLRPGYVDAMNNMGTALRDMGRSKEAEATYRQALGLKPDEPGVLNNLALALKERGQLEDASALLQRSSLIDPNRSQTMTYLALVRLEQKQIAEAEIAAAGALALAPREPEALNAMGLVRYEQQDQTAARSLFQSALALKPDLADAHNNIANVLKEEGDLAAAREACERAVALAPHEAAYYLNLADMHKFDEGDAHMAAMASMMRRPETMSDTARSRLNFALAKAHDDIGQYREAFACMHQGNALKRRQIAYDEAETLGYFDRIRATFDRHLLARRRVGYEFAVPVFIVGMPRSGTTLVEQILASHPAVHGAGELKTLSENVNVEQVADGKMVGYPELVPILEPDAIRRMGENYVAAIRRLAPETARVTDKMPANFLFVGMIHLALPDAQIIHVRRDPRDTCLSCYSKLFAEQQHFSYELGELGRYFRKYAELMAHWREVLPAGRMLEIHYEDVVADLEAAARRIVDHCGLDWDPNCISFHEHKRRIRTASASQVRRPIYRSSEGRWQAYEDHLGPLLTALSGG